MQNCVIRADLAAIMKNASSAATRLQEQWHIFAVRAASLEKESAV